VPFSLLLILFWSVPLTVTAEEMLSWENCVAEAKATHPDLISADEKLRQAKSSQRIVSSRLLPQIGGSLSLGCPKPKTNQKVTVILTG